MPRVSIPITILRLPNVESGRRPIIEKIKILLRFIYVGTGTNQSMRILMTLGACDLHDFFNVAWQTVDVRKARKIVMKGEIV